MRKLLLISLFLMFFIKLPAPGSGALMIVEAEAVKPFEQLWRATCKVESSNNPFAIGDKHLKNHSYGIAQIRSSRLDDFKRCTGINYTLIDMYTPEKAKSVFMHYAVEIGPYNNERISREWNAGPKGMQKKSTLKYWKLIQKEL